MIRMQLAGLVAILSVGLACSPGSQTGADSATNAPADTAAPNATISTGPAGDQPLRTAAAPVAGVAAGVPVAVAPVEATAAAEKSPVRPLLPPQPSFVEVTVPAGTPISLALQTAVSSDGSRVEDTVRATVTTAVVIDGKTVVPEGAELVGNVLEAIQSGRVKGRASVAFRFTRLNVRNEAIEIRTARIAREAEATKGEDAKKVGIGAAAGGVIGAIAGGKKGAAIGGAVGAGAGTGVVVATRGEEVRLGVGAPIRATLDAPVRINVPLE